MSLTDQQIQSLAARCLTAESTRTPMDSLRAEFPGLDLPAAYAVQRALIGRKVSAGDRVIGAKTGLTSKAKQVQMGVDHPIYGILNAGNLLPAPVVPAGRFIHPRVEPEMALILGEDLRGPGVNALQVLGATRYVCAALEVIDSRYSGFKFTLPDVVCDNASTAGIVLGGQAVKPADFDLGLVGVVAEINGRVVATGAGAAVLDHPLYAVAWLANQMAAHGQYLRAGDLVLAGAITEAFPLGPGDTVTALFDRLGTVTVRGAGPEGE